MQIAVIGAGLAGLACARTLLNLGISVTVYEKAEHPSGRMTTHETEFGGFDYGAQYFTTSSEEFIREVSAWRKAGVVDVWQGKLVNLQNGKAQTVGRGGVRYVAVPGMSALGAYLAQDLEVRTGQLVTQILPWQETGKWILAVQSATVPVAAHAGPFDAVVVAAPADQAAPLLAVTPSLHEQAAALHLQPCWALELAFPLALDLGYDGAFIEGSRLSFIAHDNSKPQHRAGERWVAHASHAWSSEHLHDSEERARDKLLKAFHEVTGSQVQPVYAHAWCWRYAQAAQPLASDFLWDEGAKVGACGDWFATGLEGGGRVENAWLSGHRLALKLAAANTPAP